MSCDFLTFCNLDFLLLSTLFVLPFYGLTAGVDTVLRVSLLLSLLCILSHLLPTSTHYFILKPFSQIGLLGLLWAFPIGLLPNSIIWVYNLALQLSGPILFLQEVLFVIVLATDLFNYLADLAEDDDEKFATYNGIITAFSILFYSVALYIIFIYFDYSWIILFLLSTAILNSILMYLSGCGQLWESGFTFFLSTLIFLAMQQELRLAADTREMVQSLSTLNPKNSLFEFILGLCWVIVDKFEQLKMWLLHFMTPMFVASFFIRLLSVNWVILKMPSLSNGNDEDVIIEEEENKFCLKCQSALICKLCTIFVLTQLTCDQFYELTGQGTLFQRDWLKAFLPDQVLFSRILQIILANITLQHSIYRRWQDGDTRDSYI